MRFPLQAALFALCSLCIVSASPAWATSDDEDRPARGSSYAASSGASSYGWASSSVLNEARRYIGTNPTGRRSLWCAAFMDMVLRQTGHKGGGALATGYLSYGPRVHHPVVGALAISTRKGGGHVGVVSGVDAAGNPIIVSGNFNNTVAEAAIPRSSVLAYVLPGN